MRSLNEMYKQSILGKFNFSGRLEEIMELRRLVCLLGSVPAGGHILNKLMPYGRKVPLSFSRSSKGMSSDFDLRTKCIRVVRIDMAVPGITRPQQLESMCLMVQALAHELQHYCMCETINQMLSSVCNIDELRLALRVFEANACFAENRVRKDLISKYPETDVMYVYHDPQDPPGHMRLCSSENDARYIKYGGKTLRRLYTKPLDQDATSFVLEACMGANSAVEASVQGEIRAFKKRGFALNSKKSKERFHAAIDMFLREMNVDLSPEELLEVSRRNFQAPFLEKLRTVLINPRNQ